MCLKTRWSHEGDQRQRTAPALFDLEREGYQHWFDGLAKRCAFELHGDEASPRCRSRFVRSEVHAHATRSGTVGDDNSGTAPRRGLLAAARMLFEGRARSTPPT
jgi:carotenoid cleavage dioxygenase-like enzyme